MGAGKLTRLAPREVIIQNVSGEVMPARGVGVITGLTASGILTVSKPGADSISPSILVIIGRNPLGDNAVGVAVLATTGSIYAKTAASPAVGVVVGTTSGSWEVATGKIGFTANGSQAGRVRVSPTVGGIGTGDGTPPIITSEAGTVGVSANFRRADTKPGLKLFATNPGLLFKAADAGLSALYTTTPAAIARVADDTAGDATSGAGLAHVGHAHKLVISDGLKWAGTAQTSVLVVKTKTAEGTDVFADAPGNKTIGVAISASGGNIITKNADGLFASGGANHDILSATHSDTLAAAVVAGDLMIGNATPKWSRFGIGSSGQFLKVVAGAPAWSSETIPSPEASTPSDVSGTVGSAGSDADYSRGDHVHAFDGTNFAGNGISWTAGQFRVNLSDLFVGGGITKVDSVFSADGINNSLAHEDHTHGFDGTAFAGTGISWDGSQFNVADVPGSGTNGDMLRWAGGAWSAFGIGSADQVLTVDTGAPEWRTPSAVAHNWISATHSDTTTVAAAHGVIFGTTIAQDITLGDGQNIIGQTTTGHQIGTAAAQKWAFHGATPVVQASHIADPSGGATVDSEARTAIDAILVALENKGILAAA